jgi:hypothetical protein
MRFDANAQLLRGAKPLVRCHIAAVAAAAQSSAIL